MPGVPGRSGGCQTCRRRKVKCDETKPACIRCTRGGFECLGYKRELQWVTSSTALFPQSVASQSSSHDIPGAGEQPLRSATSTVRIPSPPAELGLSAFAGDFYYSSMFSNFVWRCYGVVWLPDAVNGKLGVLAHEATKALAKAAFGRLNGRQDIEMEGMETYGLTLNSLALKLGDGLTLARSGPELLIPILVLIMHSAANSDREGAVFHLKGLAKLLHVQGPANFQQQPYRNAFEAARAPMIMASLISKQRLFLETESWRDDPWALDPASKLPQSHLMDILVVVPGILQDHASLEHGSVSCGHTIRDILRRTEQQLVKLYQWRGDWQSQYGRQIGIDYDAATIPGASFPRLRFGLFVIATDIMLYNATLMWLLALLWKLDPITSSNRIRACAAAARSYQDPASLRMSFEPLSRPGVSLTVREPAMEICRTFEWVSRHHSRSREPSYMYLFPMGMAMSVLETEPETMAWTMRMLRLSPVTADYALGQNTTGFGFYITQQALLHPGRVQPQMRLFSIQELGQMQ